ncbi:MAG: hypothetical protein ACP5TX_06065 [Thermoplasmata archaeon]
MSNKNFEDTAQNEEEVISKIYHEDKLLADRNAGYMSVNAFLFVGYVTALALIRTPGLVLSIIQFSGIVLGIFLGIFHIAIGKRTEFAISFLRAYERAGATKIKDQYLFEFYKEGKVLGDGCFISTKSVDKWTAGKQGTMFYAIPWRWKFVGSVNNVVGVVIPLGLVFFWIAMSFTIQTGLPPFYLLNMEIPVNFLIGFLILAITITFLAFMWSSWPNDAQEFSASDTLLAVLGRGIQFQNGRWTLSPDIEIYQLKNDKPEHSPVPLKPGTQGTVELIGGGSLNVEAAALLLNKIPMTTLVGYAPPAAYLKKWDGKMDGPSEGQVMGEKLKELVPSAKIEIWPQDGYNLSEKESNTKLEVRNIVQFAESHGFHKIIFITVSAHLERLRLNASQYKKITFEVISSEEILSRLDPSQSARIEHLKDSEANKNTIKYELIGTLKLKEELRKRAL